MEYLGSLTFLHILRVSFIVSTNVLYMHILLCLDNVLRYFRVLVNELLLSFTYFSLCVHSACTCALCLLRQGGGIRYPWSCQPADMESTGDQT